MTEKTRTFEHTLEIDALPEKVWKALTDAQELVPFRLRSREGGRAVARAALAGPGRRPLRPGPAGARVSAHAGARPDQKFVPGSVFGGSLFAGTFPGFCPGGCDSPFSRRTFRSFRNPRWTSMSSSNRA